MNSTSEQGLPKYLHKLYAKVLSGDCNTARLCTKVLIEVINTSLRLSDSFSLHAFPQGTQGSHVRKTENETLGDFLPSNNQKNKKGELPWSHVFQLSHTCQDKQQLK